MLYTAPKGAKSRNKLFDNPDVVDVTVYLFIKERNGNVCIKLANFPKVKIIQANR